MATKVPLEKVDEYRYRIPQTYKPGMRTAGLVYADEELLPAIKRDLTLEQVANVACLPGIVGLSLAMPDAHQGYGFPIGGVAATEGEHGVISPGGVGFDICCLTGDARILHAHGYTLPLEQFAARWVREQIRCFDEQQGCLSVTGLRRFLSMRPRQPVYRLLTRSGQEVKATADHPFFTPEGMRPLEELQVGDRVAVCPFEGVPHEEPSDEVIVDEEDVQQALLRLDKGDRGNSRSQILAHLKRRGLLPLRYSSPQLPYLIKLLAYLTGDGTIYFLNGHGKGVCRFYGQPEDLEQMRADVRAVGFTPSKVYPRERQHVIPTDYGEVHCATCETSFRVTGSAFAVLMIALGAPLGSKAKQDFHLPTWLKGAPRWQQRLYLAALFGAGMNIPEVPTGHQSDFYAPALSLNKQDGFVASGRAFLEEVAELLAHFGVETGAISQQVSRPNPEGSVSYCLRLPISNKTDNLIRLWSRVGFEYHREKAFWAHVAVHYLRAKERAATEVEIRTIREATGGSAVVIYEQLEQPAVNLRFVERTLYGQRRTNPRILAEFPSFAEFATEATEGLGRSGLVWDEIAAKERWDYIGPVYDFTVAHPSHNFVAEGFLVSNCGVRLLTTPLEREEIQNRLKPLLDQLFRDIPSGTGKGGRIRLSRSELNQVLEQGAQWAVRNGYGWEEDIPRLEECGRMEEARAQVVSDRAKQRGRDQLGTLGSGNHFLEIQYVDEVYEEALAQVLGLHAGQIVVLIHTGSRGLGHQVATDYLEIMKGGMKKYHIQVPDRQLACIPIDTPEGRNYFRAMCAAANFAYANRQCITHWTREAFQRVVGTGELHIVYDVTHNIAKIEEHEVDGEKRTVIVHRKGATRAFPAHHPDVPELYKEIGQPVLIPGSMGTCSYVLVGTEQAMRETFGSVCHGAGRVMSRHAAKRGISPKQVRNQLEAQGIIARSATRDGLTEERPEAYKDVSEVVRVVHNAGLAKRVARLTPLAVMKG